MRNLIKQVARELRYLGTEALAGLSDRVHRRALERKGRHPWSVFPVLVWRYFVGGPLDGCHLQCWPDADVYWTGIFRYDRDLLDGEPIFRFHP